MTRIINVKFIYFIIWIKVLNELCKSQRLIYNKGTYKVKANGGNKLNEMKFAVLAIFKL